MDIWGEMWKVLGVLSTLVAACILLIRCVADATDVLILLTWLLIFAISVAAAIWDEKVSKK